MTDMATPQESLVIQMNVREPQTVKMNERVDEAQKSVVIFTSVVGVMIEGEW
jgi:hypothetical protein